MTKTLIIAEVGSVHDGSFGNAKCLVDAAAECGADAVKFQTHIAPAETLHDAPMPPYFSGEPRYEYFKRTAFSLEQLLELKAHCGERDMELLSSPFSIEAVELLEKVGVLRYKVPSGEVVNLPMLEVVAQTGKPVLLSSGMASWAELDEAVDTILRYHDDLTLLQCTSEYPCPYEHVGLNVIGEMRERYQLPVGLSDHTLSIYASIGAVALGASVIEKHFTFSRRMYGSDARHSVEPEEFVDMVRGIRALETMVASSVDKNEAAARLGDMKDIFEKSVVSLVEIPEGVVIAREMIGIKKPGTGISACRYQEVVGRRAARTILADRLLQDEDIDWDPSQEPKHPGSPG